MRSPPRRSPGSAWAYPPPPIIPGDYEITSFFGCRGKKAWHRVLGHALRRSRRSPPTARGKPGHNCVVSIQSKNVLILLNREIELRDRGRQSCVYCAVLVYLLPAPWSALQPRLSLRTRRQIAG